MRIILCDKCKSEVDERDTCVVKFVQYPDMRTVAPDHYELCQQCAASLKLWFISPEQMS